MINMPLGNKRKGAIGVLQDLEKTNGFRFTDDLILPPELLDKKQREMLEGVYKKNVGYYKLTTEEQKQEKENMEKLVTEITDKIKEYGGKIQSYVGSEGGSDYDKDNKEKKSKTEYIVLNINDVLIFEPLGQPNNATFIGNAKNEELAKELERNGRLASVKNELLGRIFHKRTSRNTYDYESGHVLEIMDFANEYPQDFLEKLFELMKTQDYCMLSTIDSLIPPSPPNNVHDIIENVKEQVTKRGITSQEVASVGLEEKENENEIIQDNSGDDRGGRE